MTMKMHFIGVTTAQSRIMSLFPVWMGLLGLSAEIVGRDLPIDGEPEAYRQAVAEIAADDEVHGALVTTHKVDVYRHAGDLFAKLDRWASLCGEVSCISKVDGQLVGHAKDPVTSWRSLQEILEPDHFDCHPEAEVLCMGAGGSGTAITSRLLTEDEVPARIIVTNRSPEPLERLREIHSGIGVSTEVEYRRVSSTADSDALLHTLAPHSLIINATGMGKDIPGSPLSDDARFPEHGVVWELNYRGDLGFLEQARRQTEERRLSIHDGWDYFVHGWSEHIAEVFDLDLRQDHLDTLAQAAEPFRP